MYFAAESGKRDGFIWGSITVLWIVGFSYFLGFDIGIVFLGFIGSFLSMFILNIISDPKMK